MAEDTRGSRNEGDTAAQITRLREQVEALMRDCVTPAVAEAAGRAEAVIHGATDTLRSEVESLASKVREQPLLAILIAAMVGFALGRVIR
jgi:ElaB/YqjD/DUF883 family membrane-anchored ribosome-binding protein